MAITWNTWEEFKKNWEEVEAEGGCGYIPKEIKKVLAKRSQNFLEKKVYSISYISSESESAVVDAMDALLEGKEVGKTVSSKVGEQSYNLLSLPDLDIVGMWEPGMTDYVIISYI